jgi:hypothetical protein
MHLKRWSAKRSGAGMRVTGFDTQLQKDAKVQVIEIAPRRGGLVVAIEKDGTEHTLSLE